jgi:hypothetical protein
VSSPPDPRLIRFFDLVLQKIAEHPSYAGNLDAAVRAGEPLVLDYHTHGPEHGYCVSLCAAEAPVWPIGADEAPPTNLRELAHIRGIAREASECGPMMRAFSSLLEARFPLSSPPEVYLDGQPFREER